MTWIDLTFQVNVEVDDPKSSDLRGTLEKIRRIIKECLDITDEKMIESYDSVRVDWKVVKE